MNKTWILIVLIQAAHPAFETAFKFQYIGGNRGNFSSKDSIYSCQPENSFGLIFPFGQPFLKLKTMNYKRPLLNGSLQLYLATSGDNLYRETMLENQFQFSIHQNYQLGILLDTYLISIKNYSSQSTITSGIKLRYHNPDYFSFLIEHKNGFFLINHNLKRDIPEQIRISFYQDRSKNHFNFSIIKDLAYPLDLQLFWRNAVHSNLALNFGIFHSSQELLVGIEILTPLIKPFIFILYHPELGISYGGKIKF